MRQWTKMVVRTQRSLIIASKKMAVEAAQGGVVPPSRLTDDIVHVNKLEEENEHE